MNALIIGGAAIAVVVVLVVLGLADRYVLARHRHARTLANIARLEVELGIREPEVPRQVRAMARTYTAALAAKRWNYAALMPNLCPECGRVVDPKVGRCDGMGPNCIKNRRALT